MCLVFFYMPIQNQNRQRQLGIHTSLVCCDIFSIIYIESVKPVSPFFLILLESGDIGQDSEAHPCGEGEVWREAFDDTGIGGCYQEMKKPNNNNNDKILNRWKTPLNNRYRSQRFPLASNWIPLVPHQRGGRYDHHEFCGRCIRNRRVQLCCEGDGMLLFENIGFL